MVLINKTLIAYASKGGATEEAAKIIADGLKSKYDLDVDVVNLRKDKKKLSNLDQYTNVVVGSGIRQGKGYNEALDFLKQDFGDKRVAFFVCWRPTKIRRIMHKIHHQCLSKLCWLENSRRRSIWWSPKNVRQDTIRQL